MTPLGFVRRNKCSQQLWLYACKCGITTLACKPSVDMGLIRSCGCYQRETARKRSLKHGESRMSTEYCAWLNMKARCYNKGHNSYLNYGGRGIEVCSQWKHSFETFLDDMGRKPSRRHSLDRIDNDGNYGPDNCRWATWAEQAMNKRPRKRRLSC